MNYYNENDPHAAKWLQDLINRGLLPDGWVDTRSIEDVKPSDLAEYTQHHFFAGIGGWPLALRLAGWPADVAVWTGSCPCQPFSGAGRGKGTDDPRHLWPAFRWLIQNYQPAVVFGEQVASPAGRQWFTGVQADLEILGYGSGVADLCAASVGAPHIRQRLFWVAESSRERCERQRLYLRERRQEQGLLEARGSGEGGGMGVSGSAGTGGHCGAVLGEEAACPREWINPWDLADCTVLAGADGKLRRIKSGLEPLVDGVPGRMGLLRGYGNAIVPQVAAEFIQAYLEVEL